MKTRWEVHFDAWHVFLGRDRRYVSHFKPRKGTTSTPPAGEFEILVVLDKDRRQGSLDEPDEKGRLLITVPGHPDDTEDLACFLANEIKERLCFPEGRMTLHGGFLAAERLPETPEEEAEVGEERHWVRLTIQELPTDPRPDIGEFRALNIDGDHATLLRQFNAARQVESPIERYLAFFKILEKAYAPRGGDLLHALRGSDELFEIALETLRPVEADKSALTRELFDKVLRKMVRVRGNCAHLRGKTGYSPGDPRVATDVKPLLGVVEELAKRCVEVHTARKE